MIRIPNAESDKAISSSKLLILEKKMFDFFFKKNLKFQKRTLKSPGNTTNHKSIFVEIIIGISEVLAANVHIHLKF